MKFARPSLCCALVTITVIGMAALSFAQEKAGGVERSVRLPSSAEPAHPPAPPVPPLPSTSPASPPSEAASTNPPQAAETKKPEDEMVYLNVQDQDIKDVILQISKATGKNFIIDDKVRGKVTIISEKMMTKEEAFQAFLSALEVAGYTIVTGPAGIIKVVAQRDAVSAPIPIHVDATPYTDSYVTRLVTLQSISALDMSNAIKGLISKSGNMFAYPATNTLIITDSGTNIDRLMKIIKELDQEGPQQVIEIIPILHADAKTVASTVLNLFQLEKAGKSQRPAAGGELAEIEDVSKILADERTNSLIVMASKRAITKVRDLIARLDQPLLTGSSGTIHVHYLKYANAKELAATLSSVTAGSATSKQGGAPPGAAAQNAAAANSAPVVAKLEGGVTIGADETTNALIITASAKDYQVLVDELINKLDIPRKQVYLESMIMELSFVKGGNYGLSGFGGAGAGPLLGFGQTFAATGGLASIFNQQGIVGGVIGRNNVTVNVPTVSGGTVTTQAVQIPGVAAFLSLLQTYTDANIVSSPNLLTLDNQEAEINVQATIYANKVTTIATTGATTTEPTPLKSGLTLKLTPQISEGDSVRLQIEQELSNFTGQPNTSGAAPSTTRKVKTTVVTEDGQTVVLGGLMQDNIVNTKNKVPILGDIPLLGMLFKTSTTQTTKNNMLIFITPHVIHDPSDFTKVTQRKIEERNRFITDNYGAKQSQAIRDTLRAHRADLLEFVAPTATATTQTTVPPLPIAALPPAPVKPEIQKPVKAVPPPILPPAPALPPPPASPGASPVITVPSVDATRGASSVGPSPMAMTPRSLPAAPLPSAAPRSVPSTSSSPQKTPSVQPPPAPYDEPRKLPAGTPPTSLDVAY